MHYALICWIQMLIKNQLQFDVWHRYRWKIYLSSILSLYNSITREISTTHRANIASNFSYQFRWVPLSRPHRIIAYLLIYYKMSMHFAERKNFNVRAGYAFEIENKLQVRVFANAYREHFGKPVDCFDHVTRYANLITRITYRSLVRFAFNGIVILLCW